MIIFSKYKTYFIIFSLILIGTIGYLIYFYYDKEVTEVMADSSFLSSNGNEEEKTKEIVEEQVKPEPIIYYKVDIKGAVKKTGVYSIKENSRVIDVISQAGGLNKNANTNYINLSKKIFDEMVIIVYTNEQVTDIKKQLEETKQIIEELNNENNNDAIVENINDATNENLNQDNKEETAVIPKLISINSSTKEELMTLTGIGEKKALDIINYREQQGLFKTLEELMNVPGIGEATFAKIKDHITL
ncbi:MAG: helix-hairpin-helix domain-containing protein [Bacilli bacterium]|nr:helix-hairpin-helix domain-containing protein [Bacilli bacterium]